MLKPVICILNRNQGVCPNDVEFGIRPGTGQNHIFKMTCGKHTVTVSRNVTTTIITIKTIIFKAIFMI